MGLRRLNREGEVQIKNEWIEVTIGRKLIEDAKQYEIGKIFPTDRTLTLIFHGTADTTVPLEGSLEFVRRAAARLTLFSSAAEITALADRKAISPSR